MRWPFAEHSYTWAVARADCEVGFSVSDWSGVLGVGWPVVCVCCSAVGCEVCRESRVTQSSNANSDAPSTPMKIAPVSLSSIWELSGEQGQQAVFGVTLGKSF